jgi:hypothetical protein
MNDVNITEKSMNEFIENNGPFLQSIRLWIYSKAEVLQLSDLNHFQYFIFKLVMDATLKAQADLKAMQKPPH